MNNLAKKIEKFRKYLENKIDTLGYNGEHELINIYSHILKEFDEIFQDNPDHIKNISKLIKKYCNNTERFACPICGNIMELKINRKNAISFWGCSEFPDCRGARFRGGTITINEYLKNFLLEKQEEDRVIKEEKDLGIDPRFKDLI